MVRTAAFQAVNRGSIPLEATKMSIKNTDHPMKCPNNHELNQEIKIGNVALDRCETCEGLWFDRDELRQAKDSQDESGSTQWFDIEISYDEKNSPVRQDSKPCPSCHVPLYNIRYGDSEIHVDACKSCEGIWLEKDGFNTILDFVQRKSADALLNTYLQSLLKEGKEIFTGPESLRSEIKDFVIVLKLMQFKLVFGNPTLTAILMSLPFTK